MSSLSQPPLPSAALPCIGPHRLRNRVLLAPMAGVTDLPWRRVAWQQGAGYLVGEMVSDNPALWHSAKSTLRRQRLRDAGPFVVQVAGSEPDAVAAAAYAQWQAGADIVDINFGCPAKKVCRKAAGSALLAQPALVESIAAACVAAVPIPVTAKIRSGPTPEQRNGVEIAQRLEMAGVAAVAIHGRTRACRFLGDAEWDTAAAIKQAVQLPVFVNGDITSSEIALQAMRHTGADGVMVGRGALGQPWVLGDMAKSIELGRVCRSDPAQQDVFGIMLSHIAAVHEFYGADSGVRIARKHLGWYLEAMGLQDLKSLLNRVPEAAAQLGMLEDIAQALVNERSGSL